MNQTNKKWEVDSLGVWLWTTTTALVCSQPTYVEYLLTERESVVRNYMLGTHSEKKTEKTRVNVLTFIYYYSIYYILLLLLLLAKPVVQFRCWSNIGVLTNIFIIIFGSTGLLLCFFLIFFCPILFCPILLQAHICVCVGPHLCVYVIKSSTFYQLFVDSCSAWGAVYIYLSLCVLVELMLSIIISDYVIFILKKRGRCFKCALVCLLPRKGV